MLGWVKKYPYLVLLVLAILAVFSPLFIGKFYATGDMRDVFIPLELFFRHEMAQGRLPAWQPDAAWGFPVIAAAQIGFFYPPLLALRLLPLWIYFPALLSAHFMALGVGTYVFLRKLSLSAVAAYFGAISFTLGAFVMQHITHFNIVLIIAWLPWQFLLAHRLAHEVPRRRRTVGLYILFLALPFLIGQIQTPFMMAAVASAYFVIGGGRKQVFKNSIAVGLLAIGVVAMASVQLFPTVELALQSSRGRGGDFDIVRANQYSFPLYHLPTFIFPRFYNTGSNYWGRRLEIEYGVFMGTLPLLLAAWAFFKQRGARFWKWLTIISFLLALGKLSPFRVLGFEPSLWLFSAPTRWLLFVTFSLSILAAYGLDALKEQRQRVSVYLKTAVIVLSSAAIVGNILLFFAQRWSGVFLHMLSSVVPQYFTKSPDFYVAKMHKLIALAQASSISFNSVYTFLPIVAAAVAVWSLRYRTTQTILVIITTAELLLIANTSSHVVPWRVALAAPSTVQRLPAMIKNKQARIWSVRESGDTGAFFSDPESLATDIKRALQKELLLPLLNTEVGVPGVEWPASLDLKEEYKLLTQLRSEGSYKISNRALAEQLNIGALLTPVNGIVTITPLHAWPRAFLASDASGTDVHYGALTPTSARITYTAPHDDTLVVRDTWFPGWNATVDGAPVPIQRVQGAFRAVSVPAGKHSIEMHYRSLSLMSGLLISLGALLICCMILL